jgi:hypothetical protein
MGRIFGRIIMTLCCAILLTATSQAKSLKEVYLKDGGIIKCQKIWRADGKVMVLVNRDTLVDLSKNEVDLRKTFGKKPVKAVKKKTKLKKKFAPETAAANPGDVSEPQAKPVASVAKPAPPAAKNEKLAPAALKTEKPAHPAAVSPQGAKPPAQGTPTSAKKSSPGAAVTSQQPSRPSLPLVKAPAPPPEQKPILENNMVRIALVVLLVILVIGYVLLKKKP